MVYCNIMPVDKDSDDEKPREGKVTVKLVNLTIIPSNRVTSKRYVQEWICRDDTWFVKADLEKAFDDAVDATSALGANMGPGTLSV